ncbi:MAG: nucleotide exchange factor GrpE [Verrucomicrobiae bacterium]|nr:nucleotide exchange factor GrpE [Verrucomicrobiae bacterium]
MMKAEDENKTNTEAEEKITDNESKAPESEVEGSATAETGEPETFVKEELTVEDLLEQSRKEKEELYQKVLRAAADFENFRKRTIREKEELRKFATSGLIEEMLPVLDNLELGLAAAENHPEAKAVSDGFRMVAQQIVSILQNNGLECLDPEGEDFDPNFHESVGFQPSDEIADHKVLQVVRKGYMLHGRILRAASVIVSSGPAKQEGEA